MISDDNLGTNVLTLSGADAVSFEIVGTELRLRAGTSLDYETQTSFDVTVELDDSAVGGTPDDTVAYNLMITDFDEFDVSTPVDSDGGDNSVAESATVGTYTGLTADASDADGTTNTITYSLDDNAGGRFAIDGVSGIVTVAGALDYETASSHSVVVRATSADGSSATQSFTIQVTDVNESGVTAISDSDAGADTVLENSANGTSVGITAFADDVDGTDTVSYSLDNSAGGRFAIDSVTGEVTVAGVIDREAAGSYDITVRATSTDTTSTTRVFTITIGDVDKFDVTAVNDVDGAVNEVAENAVVGTTVGVTADAVDSDATTNGITYSLIDNDGGRFAIDSGSGVVTVAGAIDRESDGATRSITVRATFGRRFVLRPDLQHRNQRCR